MPSFRLAAIAALVYVTFAARVGAGQARQPDERQRLERDADSAYARKDYQRAATLFDRLTRADSMVPRYWVQLGMSSAMVKDYATGARAFERATALRAGPVAAYNAGVAPAPCRADANYRRFDFWVGNWRVTTVGGQQVGTSHVDVVSGGCGLLESWRDMRGSEGKSLNTYDPSTRAWRQFWVGQGGAVTDYSVSEWQGTSLVFTARARGPNGADLVQRLTFTPLDGGVVRQFGEASADGGKTWGSSYDFRYHPAP
jgi:hypothetical protein